ncbi:MAG: sulfatase-like hydrolase/transferase [Phycisphaeraceae bacterium]|nr:sulfatase-like hydrolase/transferase [Phycisphaeraceae bacterium]
MPHPPLWAPRKWAHKYHPDNVSMPATVGKWYQGMPAMQLANTAGQLGAHVPTEHWAHVWAMYMGMTSMLDDCVGQIVKALKDKGLYDDTLIVFTSDHGEMLGSHRLFQKMCLYEESIHVPLLIKTPGQKTARRVTEMTDHLDLTAAILEQAGSEPITDSTEKSLLPLANGHPNNRPRKTIFAAYDGSSGQGFYHRMVRTNTHKFIHNIGDKPELYDMIEDPHETRNYANHPKVAPLQNKLANLLNGWMDQLDDPLPRAELMPDISREQEQTIDPGDSIMG